MENIFNPTGFIILIALVVLAQIFLLVIIIIGRKIDRLEKRNANIFTLINEMIEEEKDGGD